MSAADWVVLALIASLVLMAYFLRKIPKSRATGGKATEAEHVDAALPAPPAPVPPPIAPAMREPGLAETTGAKATEAEHVDPAPQAPRIARFVITAPSLRTQIFEIASPTINVGRADSSDLVLRHPSVSRHHVRITVLPGDITLLSDLGSMNGTFVNNVQVQEHRLKDQDRIAIGVYELKYQSTQGAHASLGEALARKGDLDGAIAEYREALRLNPNNDHAHAALGAALFEKRDWDGAIAECREALRLNPRNPDAHAHLGWALIGKGDWDGAYREVLRLNPKNDVAHANLGGALALKGDLDGAIAEYREALRLNPNNHNARLFLGRALANKGDWDGAMAEEREALRLNPKNDVAHANLGWVLGEKGDHDGAMAEYREALRLNPNHAGVHFLLGVALGNKGDGDGAMTEYREALRLNPNHDIARRVLNLALGMKGDWEEVIAEARAVLRLNPSYLNTHILLGAALQRKGDWDGAIAQYREALRLNPNNAAAHAFLGEALRSKGNWDGAVAEYREALRLNPSDVAAHVSLGATLGNQGDWDGAIAEYREALRLNPKNEDARGITTCYGIWTGSSCNAAPGYDADNRLLMKTYSSGDPPVSYSYDQGGSGANAVGRRSGMTDPAGTESWAYDPMGRVAFDQRTTNSVTKTTSYTYNPDGSLATLTYPSGRVMTYQTGGAELPLSANDGTNTYAANATYTSGGALATLALGGGNINLNEAYSSRLQPSRIQASSALGADLLDLAYDFGLGTADNGNVLTIANLRDATRTQSFAYDALNRILLAKTQAATGQNAWGQAFGYDPWGNLLVTALTQGTAPSSTVSVNGQNQIVGYCYDPAGNLLDPNACPSGNNLHTYAYNAEGQMVSAVAGGYTYTYDGDGQRVMKSSGKLYWYGQNGEVLTETGLGGNLTDDYVFFGGQRLARVDATGNVDYYFSDHLGSARVLTDASGNVLDDSDYYPFGWERPVASSSGNTYKFTGKERDTESGLDNFGARYNSSSIGRWMSPDPLGGHPEDPQTLNKYAYVRNNPTSLTDPTGLDFYLTCAGPDTATCQGGHVGMTKNDENDNMHFEATVVKSNQQGNLVDQYGANYTGTYTGQTVSFQQEGSTQSIAGEWKQNSDPTKGIEGAGPYEGFSFTFSQPDQANRLHSDWKFEGTRQDVQKALEAAGYRHWAIGFHIGETEYRLPAEGRNSIHFNIDKKDTDPKKTVPTTGNMHVGEYNVGLQHLWHDVLHQ